MKINNNDLIESNHLFTYFLMNEIYSMTYKKEKKNYSLIE